MITLDELKKKATSQYTKVLRASIANENVFPLVIPADKKLDKSQGDEHIFEQQEELLLTSKNKTGTGFIVELKKNKKSFQSQISKIYFEEIKDFIAFIDKDLEFKKFQQEVDLIINLIPELQDLLAQTPKIVIENQGKWSDLLAVCAYFLQNPQPNIYVRSLPIDVSTKFIENHQSVLRTLLDFLIGNKIQTEETDFFKRFGLLVEEPSIKIRFLDSSLSFHPVLSCISVWVSEFNRLDLDCQTVYIVENLTTFLEFPNRSNAIALWGGGFGVHLLKDAVWLNKREIFYWGDIDVHGFQILSQIRGHFSHIKSILMDVETFKKYHTGKKGGEFKKIELSNLTQEEKQLYAVIEQNNWRVEQEKVAIL